LTGRLEFFTLLSDEATTMRCFYSVGILVVLLIGAGQLSAEESADRDKKPEDASRARQIRQNDEQKPGQQRPGQFPGGFSPAQMVERMIAEFDTDGDEKLNADELEQLFVKMRERRGAGMQSRPGQKSRPSPGGENSAPGGESPQRPPAAD
jgi:hypothetical protein